MKHPDREVAKLMRTQHSLVTADEALRAGMTRPQIRHRVRAGEWIRLHTEVYASAHAPVTAEQALLGACLAAGPTSAASHLSAAWLLGLVKHPPDRPEITIPYDRALRLDGVTVHRSRDLDPDRVLHRRGIPYTDPLRILTDLAEQLDTDELTIVVDRALSGGPVTTAGLEQESGRRRRRGRPGPPRLLALLESRGMIGGPEPSVLEAQAMRLFRRCGIPVLHRELQVSSDRRYRIDFLIADGLSVEVDGYVYHWSPEAKSYDDARRNRLRAAGVTVLVYDWRSIRQEPGRVTREIHRALGSREASA